MNIEAGKYDLSIQENNDCTIELTIPNILSLTNANIKFSVFKSSEAIIEKTEADDIDVTGQVMVITFVPTDSTGLSGNYIWELELNDPNDYGIVTIQTGNFIIKKTYING
jgi:hypothetical protein